MEIIINGLPYKVEIVEEVNLINCVGCFDAEKQLIQIKSSLSKDQRRKTFLHELTHAYIWCYGFSDVKFNNETICNFIGVYLEQMYKHLEEFIKAYE